MSTNTRYQKNQKLIVDIESLGVNGEGIAKIEGYPFFIKDALPGEKAEITVTKPGKNYAFAHLDKIITPSKDRVEPLCPSAKICGGCQLQHLDYKAQLEFKAEKVRQNLIRIGGFDEKDLASVEEPIMGMEDPWHYRNKEQYPVGVDKEGKVIAGFYAQRSHRIIPNLKCRLGHKKNSVILQTVLAHMEEYNVPSYDETTGRGLIRHIMTRCGKKTGEWVVMLVINAETEKAIPGLSELSEKLMSIDGVVSFCVSPNTSRGNVINGESFITVAGKNHITDRIGEVEYQISPLSFYQVNPDQTERLYAKALEYADLTGSEVVWDLYCGIGTISLFLAKAAGRVRGVEIIPQAIENAKENARINGLFNTEFFVGKAEEVLPAYVRTHNEKADVIVVDPPRKGCDSVLLDTMIKMVPERIVYVSCDSATLARDLKILHEGGYELARYCACDMFPETAHVECVVLLTKAHK
ncbi:MAG: 23S rRNA (uracil(1939)-C(5))-methyltransferase RlmD [Clostridiales bacterium]|nr:23S rRNA (uracil(1939)-C(5))-methyltransferase RlmD [Clostridiales bacterium]